MNWSLLIFAAYGLLFSSACLGLAFWRVHQRREKPPVEFKLLRGPGETLRRRLTKFEENHIFFVGGWALAPLVAFFLVSLFWTKIYKPDTWPQVYVWTGVSVLIFAGALLIAIRRVVMGLFRNRADRLGYLGERFVAEKIAPLEREGFRIFHDVPAEAGDRKFNLDHVVVGPTGLWLIETKTRRKGRARPGFKDNVVAFDGTQLIWPWAEDRHGLEQAEAEARWLSEWIHKLTGIDQTTRAILALPGWWVEERKLGKIRVLNPKNIPSAIIGRGQRVLNDEQIDHIARQLDERCRDVAD